MTIQTLKDALPEFAKDLKLNLGAVLEPEKLSREQAMGIALASAIASRSEAVETSMMAAAQDMLSNEEVTGIKAAAAIMGMNNIYYRFLHLTKNEEYKKMQAGLRMNIIKGHSIDHVNFELYSLAVSVINACDMCVSAHEKGLLDQGLTTRHIQEVVRIASVVHAVSATLESESIFAGGDTARTRSAA